MEDARKLALEVSNPSAAVSATMGKAKLNGLLVDKSEVTPNVDIVERINAAKARLREMRAGCSAATTKAA